MIELLEWTLKNANSLTVASVLALMVIENIILVYAFVTRKIVPGWTYDEKDEECDGWRDIALTAVPALKEVVTKK